MSESSFGRRQLFVGVISVASAVVSVLALMLPTFTALSVRTTSLSTLSVQTGGLGNAGGENKAIAGNTKFDEASAAERASLLGGEPDLGYSLIGSYVVPVDAPWEEIWQQNLRQCTQETYEWIHEHGDPIKSDTVLNFANNATGGSVARISAIRAEGEFVKPEIDTVTVSTTECIGGGDDFIVAMMNLGVDPVAVYDDCYSPTAQWSCARGLKDEPIAGEPVAFDLDPGEIQGVYLHWQQSASFRGRFVATATIDGVDTAIDISPNSKEFYLPYPTTDLSLRIGGDGITCSSGDVRISDVCTLDDWLQMLRDL